MGRGRGMRLGLDLGGSKIHAVVVDRDGRVQAAARCPTKAGKGYQAVLERIAAVAREAVEGSPAKWKEITAVGLAVPGPIDERRGLLLMAANLGWEPSPVAADLGRLLNRPVVIGNDANLGALGEVTYGGAQGAASTFAAFLGVGLGGAFVRKGKVLNGSHGFAGEFGHIPAAFGDAPCGCGRRGCLETSASKVGLARLLREAVARGEQPRLDFAKGLRSSAVKAALDAGCPVTRAAVERCAEALAWGLVVVGQVVDPECFVLGGGLAEALGAPFLARVRAAMADGSALYARNPPDLRPAQLGDDAVAVGAAVAAGDG